MRGVIIYFLLIVPIYSISQNNNGTKVRQVTEAEKWALNDYLWSSAKYEINHSSKTVIDFDAIKNWESLLTRNDVSISRNGEYFAYGVEKGMTGRMDSLIIMSTKNSWRQSFSGVTENFFSWTSVHIGPNHELIRLGRDSRPAFFSGNNKFYIFHKNGRLCFLELGTDSIEYITNVVSCTVPPDGKNDWLAYQVKTIETEVVLYNLNSNERKIIKNVRSYDFDINSRWLMCDVSENPTNSLHIYNLNSGVEKTFYHVEAYRFSKNGDGLIVKTNEKKIDKNIISLQYVNLDDIENNPQLDNLNIIWSSSDTSLKVTNFDLDPRGKQVGFLTKNSNGEDGSCIWYWQEGMEKASVKVDNKKINPGFFIDGPVSIVGDGNCIMFSVRSKSPEVKLTKGSVRVNVWNYKDTILQTAQTDKLEDLNTYPAFFYLKTEKFYQLNKFEEIRQVVDNYAIINRSNKSINGSRFWVKDYDKDSCWLLSLSNSSRKYIFRGRPYDDLQISPDGKYLVIYDGDRQGNYFSYNLNNGILTNISPGLREWQFGIKEFSTDDNESKIHGCGIIGWINENAGVIVNDNYDAWWLDLSGNRKPLNITNGYGEKNKVVFDLMNKTDDGFNMIRPLFKEKDTLYFRAFNKQNKINGFYRKILGVNGDPEELYMGPVSFERIRGANGLDPGMHPLKAADRSIWIVKRQTATEAPNYFITSDFRTYRNLSDLQPHKKYNWLTAELHSYKALDGSMRQGVLYKPEKFDPKKKYPLIISFYTDLSDRPYQYPNPSYINTPNIFDNPAWMVSHGYLVFTPDIFFKKNQWGPSTVNSIDGAARYLSTLTYIDSRRLGACGFSNSGRFGYYLLTHSKLFAAMSIGSGFTGTDVISLALSLSHPDKKTSNLEVAEKLAVGTALGNIWENRESWIDHTAVLQADKATSPILLYHDSKDFDDPRGAEELYTAFRRLEKKLWWLQYENGSHGVFGKDAQDFTIRFTQFFDHYLKQAPAPRWMTEGIPRNLKNIEARYELDPRGSCAMLEKNHCYVCEAWNKQYVRTPKMFEKEIQYWELDDGLKEELDKSEKSEKAKLDKEGVVAAKKIVEILKNGYPEVRKKRLHESNSIKKKNKNEIHKPIDKPDCCDEHDCSRCNSVNCMQER